LLNYHYHLLILNKAGFDPKISFFFQNYLVDRKTKYFWNDFSFSFFNIDVEVGQEFAHSFCFISCSNSSHFQKAIRKSKNS